MAATGKGSGSGIFSDIKELKETAKEHAKKLKEHDQRLNGHDDEIADIDADVLTLTNVSITLTEVCTRARKRQDARERLAKIRDRRDK